MKLFRRSRPSLKYAFTDVWKANPVMVLLVSVEEGGQIRVRGVTRPDAPEPFAMEFRTFSSEVDQMAAELHAHWLTLAKEEERRSGGKIVLLPERK